MKHCVEIRALLQRAAPRLVGVDPNNSRVDLTMFQLLDGDSSVNFSPRILRGQQTPPLIAASIRMKGRHPRHFAHVSAQARRIGFGSPPFINVRLLALAENWLVSISVPDPGGLTTTSSGP
ncbi:hypothetical protein JG687_00019057 [Phytophthora cactorum]|uniref:Uncharacterized protein n=1 Tax=Phytophthora cactorum TaxID=29920 RepID=A0A329S6P6_9STRA|nr:hypothetical protein PC129_g23363 [Phytophthora cactorum]KAG6942571.1 hypothetical protein JG687_00019057 [Phytophthora cactorum]RAW31358.1 hypothetical protein PC110_g12286 [Phytophthora cactorum]